MQNQRERQVVFFDLALGTNPPGRLPPMRELAQFMVERVDLGLCTRVIERERYLIGISKAQLIERHGRHYLALLFVFADPDAADPSNMHLDTRQVRHFAKLEGEGRAVSAHALLDLAPRHAQGHIFRVLLENADRLGKTRVRAHLQAQFKAIFQDKEITVETVDGDEAPARPTVDLSAVASERLRAGIAQATLQELTLIDTRAAERGFDAPEAVEVRRREMSLKVSLPPGERIDAFLNRLKPWARKSGFEEMYVKWVKEPAPAAQGEAPPVVHPERAKINLAQEDIGETLYAKKEFISLPYALGDLCEELDDEMIGAMISLLS